MKNFKEVRIINERLPDKKDKIRLWVRKISTGGSDQYQIYFPGDGTVIVLGMRRTRGKRNPMSRS